MTTLNLILTVMISSLLAVGSWGLGKLRQPAGPAYQVRAGGGPIDQVELISQAKLMEPAARNEEHATVNQVQHAFDELVAQAELQITFETFKADSTALSRCLPDAREVDDFKRQLLNPTEKDFAASPLGKEKLQASLVPKEGESFQIEVDGKPVEFVWLTDAKCWFSKEEMATKPGNVTFKFDGEISHTVTTMGPTETQWQAALKTGAPTISNLTSGKGEYLRDENMVIGRSEMASGPKWDQPMKEGERKIATMQDIRVRPVSSDEVSQQYDIEKRMGKIKKASVTLDDQEERLRIRKELERAARAEAEKNAPKETFAYRWVIEPPI